MLSEQGSVRAEEQHGAIAGPAVAFDDADDDVGAMRRSGFAEAARQRTRHVDRGLEIEAEFFAAGRIARADHEAVVEPLRVPGNESFGKDDYFRARSRGLLYQSNRLVDAGSALERQGSRLHDRDTHPGLLYDRAHFTFLFESIASV